MTKTKPKTETVADIAAKELKAEAGVLGDSVAKVGDKVGKYMKPGIDDAAKTGLQVEADTLAGAKKAEKILGKEVGVLNDGVKKVEKEVEKFMKPGVKSVEKATLKAEADALKGAKKAEKILKKDIDLVKRELTDAEKVAEKIAQKGIKKVEDLESDIETIVRQEEKILEKNMTNPWVITSIIAFVLISVGLTYVLCLRKDKVDTDDNFEKFKNITVDEELEVEPKKKINPRLQSHKRKKSNDQP